MYIVLNMIYKWKEEEETKKMRNLTDTQVEETKLGIWFEKIINGREYTLYHFDCLARINFLTIDCYFAIFFSLFFFYWKIVVVSDVHTFYFKKKEKFLNSLFKIQIFALKEVWILCSKKKEIWIQGYKTFCVLVTCLCLFVIKSEDVIYQSLIAIIC